MTAWTQHELATLEDMADDGYTAAMIAAELPGRTPWSVRKAALRYKIPLHGGTEPRNCCQRFIDHLIANDTHGHRFDLSERRS